MDNQYQNNQNNYPQDPVPGKGMAVASLVLGICAFVVPYVGTICAIVGLILGCVAKQKMSEVGVSSGMATAGIVLSIVSLGISILMIVACASCAGAISNFTYF